MLRAYIRGRKPEIDASGYAANGVICLKNKFSFTGLDENTKRGDVA